MSFKKIVTLLCAATVGGGKLNARDHNDLTADNFKDSIVAAPVECTDFLNPSEECLQAIKSSIEKQDEDKTVSIAGGRLRYGCCSQCSEQEVEMLKNAAWDAYSLSAFASDDSDSPETRVVWETWMGRDYVDYKDRILGQSKVFPL